MATTTPIRPLGGLETYSSVRNALGLSGRVLTISTYACSPPEMISHLYTLIPMHPHLRLVISDEESVTPSYNAVDKLHLMKHINLHLLPSITFSDVAGRNGFVETVIDKPWPDVAVIPPWHIDIFAPDPSSPISILVFQIHHSLSDGMGHRHFHDSLQTVISSPPPNTPPSNSLTLSFPDPPEILAAQEDLLSLSLSPTYLFKTLVLPFLISLLPAPIYTPTWTGPPMTLNRTNPTTYHPLWLPADRATPLITQCRTEKTTLTGLLHVLILHSISLSRPNEPFSGTTPVSLRPYVNPDLQPKIHDLVSTVPQSFSSAPLAPQTTIPSSTWTLSRTAKAAITNACNILPADTPAGLLKLAGPIDKWIQSKEGKPRSDTWEVSNLGALTVDADTRMLFTQPAMPVGAPLAVSLVGVVNGGVSITVTWESEEELDRVGNRLVGDLITWLGAEEMVSQHKFK